MALGELGPVGVALIVVTLLALGAVLGIVALFTLGSLLSK